jgi:hypothetical protein
MKERSPARAGFSVLGIGAAACVACCVGPILGLLSTIGALSLLSTVFLGVVGFFVAAAAALAIVTVVVRRQQAHAGAPDPQPVPVELTRRPS